MDIALSVVVLVLAIVWIVMLRRYVRMARASTQVEWRQRWAAVDPQRRQRILATMRRGEALEDPEAAEFAGLLVANLKRLRRAVRPLLIVMVLLFAGLIAIGITEDSSFQVVFALVVLAMMGALSAFQRTRLRKLEQSAAASARLHGAQS